MSKTEISKFRMGVNMTIFIACVLIADIIGFMVNYTRDLCDVYDYILLAGNVAALGITAFILHKEKKIIHKCKRDKDDNRYM